ncbi:MAG: tRNA (N(6)-L-threonylcarbamoyladenosine(37)-C(2))-methylthiotransferase MtaB [Chloroflexi bacterium]|nr:tRNA (N(6)-L-threonylcarbamoyladenosine(37)-C(2))-methylthiotransferase MtaB [Chloroflexota bacterium]
MLKEWVEMMPVDNEAEPGLRSFQPPTVAIETHGCKLNQADSELIARQFRQAGYRTVSTGQPADVYIVNTCTVTHIADRKARRSFRAARSRNPGALIVATGCYAQRVPRELVKVEGVDLVVENRDKANLLEQVQTLKGDKPIPNEIGEESPCENHASASRTRAMVKIQEGCNQVCAYCIVPKVRGRERSIPLEKLIEQVNALVSAGCLEVVLTGTQLGSYGFDIPGMNMARLVEGILTDTPVQRLRVSSLQPQDISSELLELWSDPRLCPHFHIPLQSGSNTVLKRMRRRYTTELFAERVEAIRQKVHHVSITTDVIVGFPGETEEDFQETLSFCEQMNFADIHVFPFSSRPGTSAAYYKDKVDPTTKGQRMVRMLDLAKAQAAVFRASFIGTIRPVLWERSRVVNSKVLWPGLTDNYIRVYTQNARPLQKHLTMAELLEEEDGILHAKALV